ncbi:TlpA family protein disulfide reductase [bacterium]|nr:TlpA family protein disulfide reductase [bacterium]
MSHLCRCGKLLISIFLMLMGFLSTGCGNDRQRKAPDFVLKSLDNREVSLSSLKGNVMLLNFWATWCGPCRMEIPDLIQLEKTYHEKGLRVIGIVLGSGSAESVMKFAQRYGINYMILMGNNKVTEAYGGIRGVPTTFLIDRQGNIQKFYVGARSYRTFEKDILPLLNQH